MDLSEITNSIMTEGIHKGIDIGCEHHDRALYRHNGRVFVGETIFVKDRAWTWNHQNHIFVGAVVVDEGVPRWISEDGSRWVEGCL